MSLPASAMPTTFAPELWACRRAEEKSVVPCGTLVPPTTEPPSLSSCAVVSAWSWMAKEKSAVTKYQLLPPSLKTACAVPRDRAAVS